MTCYFTIWQLLSFDIDHNPYKWCRTLDPKADIILQVEFRARIVSLNDEMWQFIVGAPNGEVCPFTDSSCGTLKLGTAIQY